MIEIWDAENYVLKSYQEIIFKIKPREIYMVYTFAYLDNYIIYKQKYWQRVVKDWAQ